MDVIAGTFNFIGFFFFIGATTISIFQFHKDKNTSNLTFFILFLGAVLFSFGNVLDKFELLEENVSDDIAEAFKIFCAVTFFFWIIIPVIESRLIESEKKVEIRTEELKESEEKFRTITEQSLIGIAIFQDDAIKYTNEANVAILGYSMQKIKSWSIVDLFKIIYPEDFLKLQEILEQREREAIEIIHHTCRIITKGGEIKWLDLFLRNIIYQNKEAVLASVVDITEKKEAERLILEEIKKLKELDEMSEDIITRVSHELKTPLTSIYMASEIILEQYKEKLERNLSALIQTIHKGCFRLKSLIDNLLDVSKISVQKLEVNANKENLVELINECVNEMIYLISSRQLTLKLNMPATIYHEVDKIRIGQVITNIVSNAIKNTPTGGAIYISVNENPEYLDIQIRDTGVGLTDKEKERLFEKFGKIERYGKGLDVDIEGSGLGLFISKNIVNLHHGEILVESEGRNKGATFTIRLYKK